MSRHAGKLPDGPSERQPQVGIVADPRPAACVSRKVLLREGFFRWTFEESHSTTRRRPPLERTAVPTALDAHIASRALATRP